LAINLFIAKLNQISPLFNDQSPKNVKKTKQFNDHQIKLKNNQHNQFQNHQIEWVYCQTQVQFQ